MPNDDCLGRERERDPLGLKSLLQAAIELALHRPPSGIRADDLTRNRHHGGVDPVDTPKIEIAQHHAPEVGMPPQLGGLSQQQMNLINTH